MLSVLHDVLLFLDHSTFSQSKRNPMHIFYAIYRIYNHHSYKGFSNYVVGVAM
jgi:hypothetical protein